MIDGLSCTRKASSVVDMVEFLEAVMVLSRNVSCLPSSCG